MALKQISPSADAYISEYYNSRNFGTDANLYSGNFMQANDVYRSLLKFDLTQIPAGSTITSASLKLYVSRKDKNDTILPLQKITAYANKTDFSESTVTWNNAPEVDQTIPYPQPVTDADLNKYVSIDITGLVKSWFAGSKPNYGVTVIGNYESTIDSIIGYKSKEYSDNTQKPVLEITYNQFTVGKLYEGLKDTVSLSTADVVIAQIVAPIITEIALGQKVKIDYAFDLAFNAAVSAATTKSTIAGTIGLYKEETGGVAITTETFQIDFDTLTATGGLTQLLPISGIFSTITDSDGQPYYLRVKLDTLSSNITVPKANNVVLQVLTVQ